MTKINKYIFDTLIYTLQYRRKVEKNPMYLYFYEHFKTLFIS